MKPHAPSQIRGEYQTIRTSVPGRIVCEYLPRCATLVDRLAFVRSMHYGMSNHNSAMYQALVGNRPTVDLDVLGGTRSEDFRHLVRRSVIWQMLAIFIRQRTHWQTSRSRM